MTIRDWWLQEARRYLAHARSNRHSPTVWHQAMSDVAWCRRMAQWTYSTFD